MSVSKLRSRRGNGQKLTEHDDRSNVEKKDKPSRTRSVSKVVDPIEEDLKGKSSKSKNSEYIQNNGQDNVAKSAHKQEVDQRSSRSNKKTPKKDERTQEDTHGRKDKTLIGVKTSDKADPDNEGSLVNPISRRRTRSSGTLSQTEQSAGDTLILKTPKKHERQHNLITTTKNDVEPVVLDNNGDPPSVSRDQLDVVQKSSRLTQIEKTVEALHTYAKDSSNSLDANQLNLETSTLDEAARIPKRGRPPKNVKQLQQKIGLSEQDTSSLNNSTIKIKTESLSPQRTSPRRAKTPVKCGTVEQTGNSINTEETIKDDDLKKDIPLKKPVTERLHAVSTRSSPRKRSASGKESECNDVDLEKNTLEPLIKKACKSNIAKDLKTLFDNATSNMKTTEESSNEEQVNNEKTVAHNSKQNIPEVTEENSQGAKSPKELSEATFTNSRRSRRLSGKEPEVEEIDGKNQLQADDHSALTTVEEDILLNESNINIEKKDDENEMEGEKVFEEDTVGYEALPWYQEEPDESEPFYFESDHTALKGNKDYRMLLRTLATLEAQRQKAITNLERLTECQKNALNDPILFVESLQNKVDIDLPVAQRVVAIPNINWEKYITKLEGTELLKFATEARNTRGSKSASAVTSTVDSPSTSKDAMANSVSIKKEEEMVRGRPVDGNKSGTFNQLWTVEEQRRLEECLVNYPQEEVEARRWEKVANALGNRTPQQVASRVQKYFIKLSKAGLPVPGRIPNLNMYMNKKTNRRVHHFTKPLLHQNSTFMQAYKPPVYMPDEDDTDLKTINNSYEEEKSVLDESIPPELRDTEEYQELLKLTKLKNEMLEKNQGEHYGFKCDKCGCEPIVGTRWHCKDCPSQVSIDLCATCIDSKYVTDSHKITHRMDPIKPANPNRHFEDKDYTSLSMGLWDYNYLDPNYNPANL